MVPKELESKDWSHFSVLIRNFEKNNTLEVGSLAINELRLNQSICKYTELLQEKNKQLNLTAIRNFDECIWKHFYDSFLIFHFPLAGAVLDWGTGGGFPGVAIASWKHYLLQSKDPTVLLDSRAKKVLAVADLVQELDPDLRVVTVAERGEKFIQNKSNQIDHVVFRAVAQPELCVSWLSKKIHNWYFYTGPQGMLSWEAQRDNIKKRNFRIKEIYSTTLPFDQSQRHIVHIVP